MSNVTILIDGVEAHSYTVESTSKALVDELVELKKESGSLLVEMQELKDKIDEIVEEMGGKKPVPTDALTPADNIQEHIKNGATLLLSEGVYHQTLDFSGKSDVTIQAVDGHDVLFSGLTSAPWDWTQTGDVYVGEYPGFKGLWHHKDPATEFNTDLSYPLFCAVNGEALIWKPSGSLNPGEFFVTSEADKPGTIKVRLKSGQSIRDFNVSPFARLVWGNKATSGITIKNVNFQGCSNTGFTGAVNLPGKGWNLEDVKVSLVNTIGIELGQGGEKSNMRSQVQNIVLRRVSAIDCGQMGFWGSAKDSELIDCGHEGSNWKAFDHQWHASNKFENTHNCTFVNWFARNCNGPGLWFDGVYLEDGGGNSNNTIESPVIENCVRTGIELELGTSNNTITNATIKGIADTVTNPGQGWSQSTAFMVKASSDNNKIIGATVSHCEKVVTIDNNDPRGKSRNNTFENISHSNITEEAYVIYGSKEGNELPG